MTKLLILKLKLRELKCFFIGHDWKIQDETYVEHWEFEGVTRTSPKMKLKICACCGANQMVWDFGWMATKTGIRRSKALKDAVIKNHPLYDFMNRAGSIKGI